MKIVVGEGSCGIASGAKKTENAFRALLEEKGLDQVTLTKTGCIGTCYLEPIVDVYGDDGALEARYVKVQPEVVPEIVEKHIIGGGRAEEHLIPEEDAQILAKQKRVVLRNCGLINPEFIEEYLEKDGYKAAEKVLTTMSQEDVIEEMKISGLRGRGGAGFPTWFKWNAARQSQEKRNISSVMRMRAIRAHSWIEAFWRETPTLYWRA